MDGDKLQVYLGIDPGFTGGMALMYNDVMRVVKMPGTPKDCWDWLKNFGDCEVHAVIEQQSPRPTFFKGTSSILKSTCLLYGHYQMLKAFLVAAGISHEDCPPQRWQKALCFPSGEPSVVHKRKMKERAQALFPKVRVTLDVADALLLAHYCRLKQEGRLGNAVKNV